MHCNAILQLFWYMLITSALRIWDLVFGIFRVWHLSPGLTPDICFHMTWYGLFLDFGFLVALWPEIGLRVLGFGSGWKWGWGWFFTHPILWVDQYWFLDKNKWDIKTIITVFATGIGRLWGTWWWPWWMPFLQSCLFYSYFSSSYLYLLY